MIIQMLISNPNDSIMIPIPQYPLYSASVALNGGNIVPYYLNEEKGWQLDIAEAEQSLEQAKK
jgi:alanine transaminase